MTRFGYIVKWLLLGTLPLLTAVGLPAYSADGDTLSQVKSRGTVRCAAA
jgi:hypothetical protein